MELSTNTSYKWTVTAAFCALGLPTSAWSTPPCFRRFSTFEILLECLVTISCCFLINIHSDQFYFFFALQTSNSLNILQCETWWGFAVSQLLMQTLMYHTLFFRLFIFFSRTCLYFYSSLYQFQIQIWQIFLREHLLSIMYPDLCSTARRSISVTTSSSCMDFFYFFFKRYKTKLDLTIQACHELTVNCPQTISISKCWLDKYIWSQSCFYSLLFNLREKVVVLSYGTYLSCFVFTATVVLENQSQ